MTIFVPVISSLFINLNFKNMSKFKALIETKSNYKNLNNEWVNIIEFLGSIIYCSYYCKETQKQINFDVNINEVKSIKQTNN